MNKEYWQNKRVAVTGGGGFLGSHFVDELAKLKADVSYTTHRKEDLGKSDQFVNLLDYDQTKAFLDGAEVIINCAAIDGNAEFKIKYAAQILDHNSRIVSNILNVAKENNIQDVALISSSEIYAPDTPSPIKEEYDYHQYNGHTPNGYVLSKRFTEILAELFGNEAGLRIYLPRPSNIYGPRDHFNAKVSRVIPSFITKIGNNESIQIWGDGTQVRQFIYVTDVVKSVLSMIEKKATGQYNISTDESISILELAKLVGQVMNKKPDILLDPSKSSGVHNRILDVSKISNLLDFEPLALELGISLTVDWYQKHGSN